MKRLLFVAALATGLCFAQEGADQSRDHKGAGASETEGGLEIWKWANFLVLAGGLGYLIGKNAGPFFAARSANIRKDMEESLRQRQDAETRAAEIERRLAGLDTEIAALRDQSEAELKANADRIAAQTAADVAKIQVHAGQEIASAGKAARADLKRHAAELALGLAEQKVRARMTQGAQDALVDSFVRDLQ